MHGLDPVADEGRARAFRVALIRHYKRIAIFPLLAVGDLMPEVIAMALVLAIVPLMTFHVKSLG